MTFTTIVVLLFVGAVFGFALGFFVSALFNEAPVDDYRDEHEHHHH